MRTLLSVLILMIIFLTPPAYAEVAGETLIHSENFVILPGGAVASADKLTGTAGLGATTFFSFDPNELMVKLHIGPEPPPDLGPNWLAATAGRRGGELTLQLQRFLDGELVTEEVVGLSDFQAVTRELFTEPGTGRRHVIRFTPEIRTGHDSSRLRALAEAHLSLGHGPVLRNGEMLRFLDGRSTGERLFFHIPEVGFVQLALRAWGDARPVGRLEGGVVSFSWDGDDYEFYSRRTAGDLQGDWKIWVLMTRGVPDDLAPLLQDVDPGEFVVGSTSLP